MSLEQTAIAAGITSREAFDLLDTVLDPDQMSGIGRLVARGIRRFYKTDEGAVAADRSVVEANLSERYPKSAGEIRAYFESLPDEPSVPNIRQLAANIKQSQIADELMICLAKGQVDESKELMNAYVDADKQVLETTVYNGQPWAEFFGRPDRARLPACPRAINSRVDGGIPRKSQVGVCARPNVGKSSFLANWAATYARNGLTVLYITNEDTHEETSIRLFSRLLGVPRKRVEEDPEAHRVRAMEVGFGNIYVEFANPGSLPEIRALVSAIRPDLVIVDQLYPIIMASKEGPTLALANVSVGTRQIAREFDCLMVIVTQQDKASSDRLYLRQEDAEWSSTGFAAQLDLMIGLARNEKMERVGRVLISFPRWKFGPRIEPLEVKFEYETCKVTT